MNVNNAKYLILAIILIVIVVGLRFIYYEIRETNFLMLHLIESIPLTTQLMETEL